MKERSKVVIDLQGAPPDPYRRWIAQRNGTAGLYVAKYLGVPFDTRPTPDDFLDPLSYVIPSSALTKRNARESFAISSEEDFYGTAFTELAQANKTMFYPAVSLNAPSFYSSELSRELSAKGLVLPGFSGFSKEAIINAYPNFANDNYNLRLVAPNGSDGNGQFQIETQQDLKQILETFDDREIAKEGIVMVADLDKPETLSVGSLRLGNETFHFFAEQKNIRGNVAKGQTTFGGSYLTVARNFEELRENAPDATKYILDKGRDFLDIYKKHVNPLASRLSVDMVFGQPNKTHNGKQVTNKGETILLGGTDITPRFGGHCPALALTLEEFKQHPDVRLVKAEVTLNYDPQNSLASEQGAIIFIDNQELRLTARTNQVIKGGIIFQKRV